MHVKGKVCIVTGAASGIGAAVARAYAEAGARGVVVADLKTSRDRLAAVAGDIDGLAVTADVGGKGFNGPSTFTFDVDGDRVARMTIRA